MPVPSSLTSSAGRSPAWSPWLAPPGLWCPPAEVKAGPVQFADSVHVEAVVARRQVLHAGEHGDLAVPAPLPEVHLADAVAAGVDQARGREAAEAAAPVAVLAVVVPVVVATLTALAAAVLTARRAGEGHGRRAQHQQRHERQTCSELAHPASRDRLLGRSTHLQPPRIASPSSARAMTSFWISLVPS